jgi:hypothetical protein
MAGLAFNIDGTDEAAALPAGVTVGQSLFDGVVYGTSTIGGATITTSGASETTMQFTYTTSASGSGSYLNGVVMVASTEDLEDIRAADRAIREAREKGGTRSWRLVKKELGL